MSALAAQERKATDPDTTVCHTRVPGELRNYCGAPVRLNNMHTFEECVALGHERCQACSVLDSRPQG